MTHTDSATSPPTRVARRRGRAVLWLLRSPAHALVSGSICALRLVTRRSGTIIEFPVQYARTPNGILVLPANSARKTWWRNLARPAPVEVWLDGGWRRGTGRLLPPGTAEWTAALTRYRTANRHTPHDVPDPLVDIQLAEVDRTPRRPHLWRAWVAWVTAGEVAGFAAPAVVGALTADLPGLGPVPWLLAAGAVEGAALGAAQALVLGRVLPSLSRRRWIGVTAAAAVVAYALGLVPSVVGDRWRDIPVPLLVLAAAALGVGLLLSIGVAQWTVLRRHLPRAGRWVAWTAAGWLLGLAAFMLIATPLWHEGQPVWLIVAIGLLAATVMAATAAAVTGAGLLRLLRDS